MEPQGLSLHDATQQGRKKLMFSLAVESRRLRTLAVALAIANVALWFGAPWLRSAWDAAIGRSVPSGTPIITAGVQELIVYYDPWLALWVFPALYTFGFVALALLYEPSARDPIATSQGRGAVILLLGLEAVWVFLVAFPILFRGVNWNLISPWDGRVLQVFGGYSFSFSELFYAAFLGVDHRAATWPWIWREAPGLLLTASYFLVGQMAARSRARGTSGSGIYWCSVVLLLYLLTPLALRKLGVLGVAASGAATSVVLPVLTAFGVVSYLVLRWAKKRRSPQTATQGLSGWRCALFLLLAQFAALVPIKMVLYWLFDLHYFIATPDDIADF